MLFKALIERLLGSSEAQDWKEQDRAKTSRFSYDNYPSLLSILSGLLDPTGPIKQTLETSSESSNPFDLHGAEGVFPALQILRRDHPRVMSDLSERRSRNFWRARTGTCATWLRVRWWLCSNRVSCTMQPLRCLEPSASLPTPNMVYCWQ
jgi:hypothetical protein